MYRLILEIKTFKNILFYKLKRTFNKYSLINKKKNKTKNMFMRWLYLKKKNYLSNAYRPIFRVHFGRWVENINSEKSRNK